jgi:hypothetical protein
MFCHTLWQPLFLSASAVREKKADFLKPAFFILKKAWQLFTDIYSGDTPLKTCETQVQYVLWYYMDYYSTSFPSWE